MKKIFSLVGASILLLGLLYFIIQYYNVSHYIIPDDFSKQEKINEDMNELYNKLDSDMEISSILSKLKEEESTLLLVSEKENLVSPPSGVKIDPKREAYCVLVDFKEPNDLGTKFSEINTNRIGFVVDIGPTGSLLNKGCGAVFAKTKDIYLLTNENKIIDKKLASTKVATSKNSFLKGSLFTRILKESIEEKKQIAIVTVYGYPEVFSTKLKNSFHSKSIQDLIQTSFLYMEYEFSELQNSSNTYLLPKNVPGFWIIKLNEEPTFEYITGWKNEKELLKELNNYAY